MLCTEKTYTEWIETYEGRWLAAHMIDCIILNKITQKSEL